MFNTNKIIELLNEVIKTLNEIKENQAPRYDAKVKELIKLKRRVAKCNDLDSLWNEIESTKIRKDKLLKDLSENENNFDTIKCRCVNVINTSIAKEVCKFYK